MIKWGDYQIIKGKVTNEQQTNNKQVTTTNKGNKLNTPNKVNKTNKGSNSITVTTPPNGGILNHADIFEVVVKFYEHQVATNEKHFRTFDRDKEKIYNNSIKELDKIIRLDKYTLDEIKGALNWAVQDNFWQDHVYSLARLRRKSDRNGATKFENIFRGFKKTTKESDKFEEWARESE